MTAPESHDSLHEPWLLAKQRFLNSLEDENQHKLFREATIENLYSAASKIELDDRNSIARSIGRRLKPLVTAVTDLGEGFDAFANIQPLFLAPIWGSIRVILVIASKYRKYYERIVDTLSHIGDVLPRLRDYKRTFDGVKHSRLTQALSATYADIIILCLDIKNILHAQQRSAFQRLWKPLSLSVNKQLSEAVLRFRSHRENVEKEAETAHMIEEADGRAVVLRNHALIEANRKAELRSRLLSTLSRLNQGTKHHKLRKLRHSNTGTWLTLCDSYKAWLSSSEPSTFCLYGIPGSGKSVLASIVIEDVRNSKARNISYHYCDYADKRSLEPMNILSALVHGLLSNIEIPNAIADDIVQYYQDGDRVPDVDEVLKILSATLTEFDSVTFVIDGLDEVGEQDRHAICGNLKMLLSSCTNTLRLFVTSRDNATSAFTTPSSTTFRAQASPVTLATDINSFVRHSVRALLVAERLRIRDSGLEETIIKALVDGAKGMFLWVKYQLDDLCDAENDESVIEVLSNLPESLGETYDRLLNRIAGSKRQELVKRMFRWIICTRRPLSLSELCEGIAFTLDDRKWDGRKIPTDMPRLIRACSNLVVVDEETDGVEFAHYTLQQYILKEVSKAASPFHFDLKEANEDVGDTCLAYLCFTDFETQIVKHTDNTAGHMSAIEKAVMAESIMGRKTIGYNAIKMWKSLHEHQIASSNIDYSKYVHQSQHPPYTETLSKRFCLLEYTVEHWLSHTTEHFPELRGILANVEKDGVVEVLAEAKQHLLGQVKNQRRYVLFCDLAIRKQLLFDIRPWRMPPRSAKDWAHVSLIGWSLAANHLPLLCLSSIYDSNIQPWKLIEESGNRFFAGQENKRITRYMRESLQSVSHKTPGHEIDAFIWLYSKLLDACRLGYVDILRICVPVSADEYPSGHIRGHLLFEAVASGQEEMVRFLCASGHPIEICSSYEKKICNALDMAALSGNLGLVKSLQDYGYIATSALRDGNFLYDAIETGNAAGVEAILEALKSSEIDGSIQHQKTEALITVCSQTEFRICSPVDFKILQLFLEDGVDPTSPGQSGRSPMAIAVTSGQHEVVKAMLVKGYGSAGFYGSDSEVAPILWAAATGNLSMTEMLMDYGAEVLPTATRFWHNPLFVAAANGHQSVVEFLLKVSDLSKERDLTELGLLRENYDNPSRYYENGLGSLGGLFLPIWAATVNGYKSIADSLQQKPLDLNKMWKTKYIEEVFWRQPQILSIFGSRRLGDPWESSKFIEEAFWHYPQILRLLIATSATSPSTAARGRRNDSLNGNGESLLTLASAQGHSFAIESLIAAGANVDLPNSSGQTPLLLAVSRADIGLVRVLLEAGAQPKQNDILVVLDKREHEILEELLAHGGDAETKVRQKDQTVLGQPVLKGATPLIIAARGGDLRAVQVLLKAGANVQAMDEDKHRTALAHATQANHVHIVRVLEKSSMKNHMNHLFGMKV